MIHRRYINHITKLEDSQGNTLLDHADIEEELVTYYKELLSEPPFDRTPAICRITQHIPTLITPEKNKSLMRPISQEEVDQAIKEIPPGKAPGPDGFTTDFFHYCWSMVREEVCELVEESRTSKTGAIIS
jgi:hypothetical protein